MSKAQFTLRGNTAHVQVGRLNNYTKFDVPANQALKDYFHAAREAGETNRSFADTDTQYAPIKVESKTVRRIVVPAKTITIPEMVLSEEA